MRLVVRHTDRYRSCALPASAIVGTEAHMIDAAVALPETLGAQLCSRSADSHTVRASVASSITRHRFILYNSSYLDSYGITVRICHSLDGYIDEVMVERPEEARARDRLAASRRSIG